MEEIRAFVGLDVHKATISVAVADNWRSGEVRHVGAIENSPLAIGKLARKLARQHGAIEFVYEAGCCGYNVQRQLAEMGMSCRVCAPSLTPRKPGERIKNDRRDSIALARLHRAGELTYVWVPDELHEALRDLVRARHAACQDVRRDRIRIQAFLLRYDLRFEGKPWSTRHRKWIWNRQFAHPAQQIAFQAHLNALDHDEARKRELEDQIRELLAESPWAKQMRALQALKGVGPVVAATVIAEVGDFSRFAHPRQLAAYFGLAPGEHSSGNTVRPRGITKAGSSLARAVLCEAAWNYRTTPKVGQWMNGTLPARAARYQGAGVEGATTPAQDLPSIDRARQTLGRRHYRSSSRTPRVHLVDRSTRSTRRLSTTRLTIRSSEDADTVEGIPEFILDSTEAYVRGQSGADLRRTVIMG